MVKGVLKKQRLKKDETVFQKFTLSFQSPASSAETTEQQTGFYQPPATSHCGEKKFTTSLHLGGQTI